MSGDFDFTSEKVNCKAKASLEGIPVEVGLSNLGSHSILENSIVFSSRKTSENRKRSGDYPERQHASSGEGA